jgi:hypothetical protein
METQVLQMLENNLNVLRTNPYISSTLTLFLVLYAGLAAPQLPTFIAKLFEHAIFKMLILVSVLVLIQGRNYGMALMVAVGFVVSMNTLSRYHNFTLANHLFGSEVKKTSDVESSSYGPDGQSVSESRDVKWQHNGDEHTVNLRGFQYTHKDEPNHLPGGHGWEEQ